MVRIELADFGFERTTTIEVTAVSDQLDVGLKNVLAN